MELTVVGFVLVARCGYSITFLFLFIIVLDFFFYMLIAQLNKISQQGRGSNFQALHR